MTFVAIMVVISTQDTQLWASVSIWRYKLEVRQGGGRKTIWKLMTFHVLQNKTVLTISTIKTKSKTKTISLQPEDV